MLMTDVRHLLCKILETKRHLSDSVELGGKKSRWRRLKNGLPQGSVFARLLFNIYNNDQPKSTNTYRFIYADDLGIGAQDTDFKTAEESLSNTLKEYVPSD